MFDKVINGVREDGHHVLRAISAESCLNGELYTAGSLLLPALVESLPLKTTCLCFPVSPVSTWNGEASTDNVKHLFSLCTLFRRSFRYVRAKLHLYTILSPVCFVNLNTTEVPTCLSGMVQYARRSLSFSFCDTSLKPRFS